jgi:hypothetical protein
MMTEKEKNDKKFVEDWHFYHGKGKWQFIAANGSVLAAIVYLLFAIAKFLFTSTIAWGSFKQYFLSTTFLLEWLVSTVLLGAFIGYVVWSISDAYYQKLEKNIDIP